MATYITNIRVATLESFKILYYIKIPLIRYILYHSSQILI